MTKGIQTARLKATRAGEKKKKKKKKMAQVLPPARTESSGVRQQDQGQSRSVADALSLRLGPRFRPDRSAMIQHRAAVIGSQIFFFFFFFFLCSRSALFDDFFTSNCQNLGETLRAAGAARAWTRTTGRQDGIFRPLRRR